MESFILGGDKIAFYSASSKPHKSHLPINKKTTAGPNVAACRLFSDVHGGHQPCCGAPTGQVSAHAPHSVQVSASITYFPSPSEIALTGHSASHAPQEMQSSFITYAT